MLNLDTFPVLKGYRFPRIVIVYASKIRRDRPVPNDKWHLDGCGVEISGVTYWLWRAVDGNGGERK